MASDFHTHNRNSPVPALVSTKEPIGLVYPTLECHPWYLPNDFIQIPDYIYSKLSKCVALGEVGLDKLHGPALNIQERYLEKLLEIAADFHKPVVLHVVRAEAEFLAIWKRFKLQGLIHGFCGKYAHLQMWLKHGFFVSLSPKMVKYKELSLFVNETGRIGFETDDSGDDLSEIVAEFSRILGRNDLERLSDERFKEFLL